MEDVETGWCGAVVRVERSGGMHVVSLEDRRGRSRTFPLGPGFLLDGRPVVLVAPRAPAAPARPTRTASGSTAVHGAAARVARGSRIWVEGRHDAELVEKVWGDDLRLEGVVVEPLDGVDDLAAALRGFSPGPGRRVGVLVDHLVAGTKESRIVRNALDATPGRAHVMVAGHPFVDIWQAVRPDRLGLDRLAGDPPRDRLEDRHSGRARLGARRPGRRGPRVEADPGHRAHVRRPRSGAPVLCRGAHRLRHRRVGCAATDPGGPSGTTPATRRQDHAQDHRRTHDRPDPPAALVRQAAGAPRRSSRRTARPRPRSSRATASSRHRATASPAPAPRRATASRALP